MSLENHTQSTYSEVSVEDRKKRLRLGLKPGGLLFRLKTSLTRRLGGFDLDSSGNIDLTEYDAKRLAKANGLLDQPLAQIGVDALVGRPVSVDDLDSLVRDQHWKDNEQPVKRDGPLDQYFSTLEVNKRVNVPSPGLDNYWSENMGGNALPEPKLGSVNLNSYQPSSQRKVASGRSEVLDDGTVVKKQGPKNFLEKIIDSFLKGLLGALVSFFGFSRSLNNLRSKKIKQVRKKAKK